MKILKIAQRGGAIIWVMGAAAVISFLVFPITQNIKTLYSQSTATRSFLNEKRVLNGLVDFVIYGIKQRRCFSSDLINPDIHCDLDSPYSVDTLLLNPDSISFLRMAHDADSQIKEPPIPVPAQFSFTGALSSFSGGDSPLSFIGDLFRNSDVKNFKITVTRIISPRLPNSGGEIYISVDAQLLDNSNRLVVKSGKRMEIESLISLYPREIGTFALVVPNDLFIGGNSGLKGDIVFPVGSDPGISFQSPVFVNHHFRLTSSNVRVPVTFGDKVYLGLGEVKLDSKPFAPKQPGVVKNQYWSQLKSFGGLNGGLQIDGVSDRGLDVFAGSANGINLPINYASCIEMDRIFSDASLSNTSKLVIGPLSNSNNIFSWDLGLSGKDFFYPQIKSGDIKKNYEFKQLEKYPLLKIGISNSSTSNMIGEVTLSISRQDDFFYPLNDKAPAYYTFSNLSSEGSPAFQFYRHEVADVALQSLETALVSVSCASLSLGNRPLEKNESLDSPGSSAQMPTSTVLVNRHSCETLLKESKDLVSFYRKQNAAVVIISLAPKKERAKYQNATSIKVKMKNLESLNDLTSVVQISEKELPAVGDTLLEANNKLRKIISSIKKVSLLNLRFDFKFYDVSFRDGKSQLPICSGGLIASDGSCKIGRDNLYPKGAYAESRISNLSSRLDILNKAHELKARHYLTEIENSQPIDEELPQKLSECAKTGGGSTGAASWSSTGSDFSQQTNFSWNVGGSGQTLQAGANDRSPVIDSIRFNEGNSSTVSPQFQTASIAKVCEIQSLARVVIGLFMCDTLVIQARNQPLKIIGTFISNKLLIDQSAYKAGIVWSSLYHPQSVYELRSFGVLKPRFGSGPCQDQLGPSKPIWSPFPAIIDMVNLRSCNVLSLRDRMANFQWTAIDPDCGLLAGQTVTSCKHHILNYIVIEQARAGEI